MRRLLACAGLLLAASGAVAQQAVLAPSAAVSCLSPAAAQRGVPAYPFQAFKDKRPGDVQVRLRFDGPTLAPTVTVLSQQGDASFVDAVRVHAATLRVPCHDGGAPVELDFDFAFRPDDTPLPPVPVDPADAERERQLQCLAHTSGRNMPVYPPAALRGNAVQGRVLAEMRFEAPDQPPATRLLPRIGGEAANPGRHETQVFLGPLRDWTAGYRMPCLSGRPITVRRTYVYVVEGESWGFKPGITLRELLPMVRNIGQQRLQFDFTQMQCPFDVRLEYFQPNLPNGVSVSGPPVPARQPFIDWLAQTQLDLPDKSLDAVYADVLKLTVPCLKIDLNPQE
ncbi:MAG: hypothetical protein V4795_19280 [Pseudomonadota bacterium]